MDDQDASNHEQAAAARPDPGIASPAHDSLTLHTDLLGDLQVPGGVGRAVELEALAARATIYATRTGGTGGSGGTRRIIALPGAATRPGVARSAANRSAVTPIC